MDILIKPIITEKASYLSESENCYSFLVNTKANKVEIKKAVDEYIEKDVLKVEKYLGQPTGTRYEKTMNKILKDWEGLICSVS